MTIQPAEVRTEPLHCHHFVSVPKSSSFFAKITDKSLALVHSWRVLLSSQYSKHDFLVIIFFILLGFHLPQYIKGREKAIQMGYTAFNLTSMEEARGLSFKIFHSSPGCVPVLFWTSHMTLFLQGYSGNCSSPRLWSSRHG